MPLGFVLSSTTFRCPDSCHITYCNQAQHPIQCSHRQIGSWEIVLSNKAKAARFSISTTSCIVIPTSAVTTILSGRLGSRSPTSRAFRFATNSTGAFRNVRVISPPVARWTGREKRTLTSSRPVNETGFLTLTREVPASSRRAFPGSIQVWSYRLSTGFGSDPASPAVRSQFCSFIANVVLVGGKRKREVRWFNTVMFLPLALRQRTHRNVIQLSRYDTRMIAQGRTKVNKTTGSLAAALSSHPVNGNGSSRAVLIKWSQLRRPT